MGRVPFTFRRRRKTMRGGLDPVEMQRRSAEARKRKRTQDGLAGRLERVALQMVSDPATPAHVRERLLARLARSSSAEPNAVDVGTSSVRGVSLASILAEHRDEADGGAHFSRHEPGTGGGAVNETTDALLREPGRAEALSVLEESSTPVTYNSSEVSAVHFDPMRRMAELAALQNAKEREIPDPDLRPHESWDFGWDNLP